MTASDLFNPNCNQEVKKKKNLWAVAVMNWALNDPYCSVADNDASSGGSRVVNVPR